MFLGNDHNDTSAHALTTHVSNNNMDTVEYIYFLNGCIDTAAHTIAHKTQNDTGQSNTNII